MHAYQGWQRPEGNRLGANDIAEFLAFETSGVPRYAVCVGLAQFEICNHATIGLFVN